jgi:chitinase
MYKKIMALKKINPDLKIMLAVGGWNHGSGPFTQMVATEQSRAEFVENSYNYLTKYGFDGLDLGKYKLKLYFDFNYILLFLRLGISS